jgi:hypothetical protein
VYQLVLQLSPWGSTGADLDTLVDLENQHGHDMGPNEANVFIFTEDVQLALTQCIPVIDRVGLLELPGAGYREVDGEEYTRVWPQGDRSSLDVK